MLGARILSGERSGTAQETPDSLAPTPCRPRRLSTSTATDPDLNVTIATCEPKGRTEDGEERLLNVAEVTSEPSPEHDVHVAFFEAMSGLFEERRPEPDELVEDAACEDHRGWGPGRKCAGTIALDRGEARTGRPAFLEEIALSPPGGHGCTARNEELAGIDRHPSGRLDSHTTGDDGPDEPDHEDDHGSGRDVRHGAQAWWGRSPDRWHPPPVRKPECPSLLAVTLFARQGEQR